MLMVVVTMMMTMTIVGDDDGDWRMVTTTTMMMVVMMMMTGKKGAQKSCDCGDSSININIVMDHSTINTPGAKIYSPKSMK